MRLPIKDLCQIQIGLQFRGRIEPDPLGTHDVILIRNLGSDHRLLGQGAESDKLDSITPPSPPDRYLVGCGDVLFLARGQNNYAVPILQDFKRKTIAPGFFFILRRPPETRLGPLVTPEYLAWAINSPESQNELRQRSRRGTHMPLIGKADLEALRIPVPSPEVQNSVVAVDRLRWREQVLQRAIETKREILVRLVCERAVNA